MTPPSSTNPAAGTASPLHPPPRRGREGEGAQEVLIRMLASVIALAAVVASATAQEVPPGLTPVEQGVADVDPLSTSLRSLQVDLRIPAGFETVYHGAREDRFGQRSGFFARISGGITAVFPLSRYSIVPGGIEPEVPAGTVYYLGDPPQTWMPEQREPAGNRLDFSTPAPVAPASPIHAAVGEISVWIDAGYREHRVRTLLRRAARAEREAAG
jgi:hypothetical protein